MELLLDVEKGDEVSKLKSGEESQSTIAKPENNDQIIFRKRSIFWLKYSDKSL